MQTARTQGNVPRGAPKHEINQNNIVLSNYTIGQCIRHNNTMLKSDNTVLRKVLKRYTVLREVHETAC